MATRQYRGFWSSFQYVTLIAGQLLALALLVAMQQFLSEAELTAWGWRIPFFVGAGLAVVVFWLRRGLDETSAFKAEDTRTAPKSSAMLLIMKHPKEALLVMGLTAGGTLAFYTYTTYLQKFLVNTSGFSKDAATQISAAALLIFMLLQPAVGALSDKVGRRPVMIAFGVLGVLFTVPIMTALSTTQSAPVAFALALAALVIVSGYTSINAVVKAELFPAHVRALGVALPYALANALFGGTAEYAALWFKASGNESTYFWYVTLMIGISLIVFVFMRDTKHRSMIIHD
jgi:MHS family alpha-ketoglutarate permease-like MFS transporter